MDQFDVVVIGGGAAGLSAAVALARSRRTVTVFDAGDPRNAAAGHVHNFLTRDGAAPDEIYAIGRAEVERYGGWVESARVDAAVRDGDGFSVRAGERSVRARRLLFATGLHDDLPEIAGLAQRWGIDVLHCPYCHGWEVRDQRVGVLVTGPAATHQALLFRQLTPHVTVLQHTGPPLSDTQHEQLHALGMTVLTGAVTEVVSDPSGLTGVQLDDGRVVELDALVIAPRFTARAELLAPLGLAPVDVMIGDAVIGTRIPSEPTGATAVPGVWVAGNVTDVQAQVVSSAAAGLMAGAAINADLVVEDAARAVEGHRHRVYGEQAWDERYREREQTWSGRPNQALVDEVGDLTPGSALDAGAGEGGDALWLAGRGWRVTGADISTTALDRAAAQAQRVGVDVEWLHVDFTVEAAPATYDLVSAFFLHMPLEPRRVMFAHLAAAVAPGGTLLIVGHDPSDAAVLPRAGLAEMGWTAQSVAETLGDGWTIEVAEARPRPHSHDGSEVTIHDAVLRARRAE